MGYPLVGFEGSKLYQSVYLHKDERNVNAFLAMYVDDLLILNESVKVINIKTLFNSEFEM
jgi:hypothetical protein